MPTASTSQILGYSECIEPYHSNFYKRVTLSGEFVIVNKYLLRDMWERGLWNSKIKTELLSNGGTVQTLKEVPEDLKRLYKTAYEHRMKTFIDLSAERAPFLDQTQSLNLFMGNPEFKRLNSALFYAHERGLKTACYYLKQQTHASAVKPIDTSTTSVAPTPVVSIPEPTKDVSGPVCTMEEGCLSCTA
jgi:ribonucleoside-diphosphate reductase alpha chain